MTCCIKQYDYTSLVNYLDYHETKKKTNNNKRKTQLVHCIPFLIYIYIACNPYFQRFYIVVNVVLILSKIVRTLQTITIDKQLWFTTTRHIDIGDNNFRIVTSSFCIVYLLERTTSFFNGRGNKAEHT